MANQDKLKDRFATVQLTLLSIVVALILEGLLSVLFDLPAWNLLIGVQSLDVLTSALAMWVGFGYGISAEDKQPHIMDFLGPFGLLVFLNLSVRFIGTEQLAAFFFSSAMATMVAVTSLWLDCRIAKRNGVPGPVTTTALLFGVALVEAAAGGLLAAAAIGTSTAIVLLALGTTIQAVGAARSISFWRRSLAA